jgi:hypothetical protein
MLDLKKSDRNRIVIFDEASGERKGVYYTNPTASQTVRYSREVVQKKRNKIVFDAGESLKSAIRYGAEVLTGFDDFNLKENADGTYSPIDGDYAFGFDGQPISCNPESPHYRGDWKDLFQESAFHVLSLVARVAFNRVRTETADEEIVFGEEETEEILPLAKS